MRRTLNTALTSKIGRYATVQGWVHRRRRLGAVSFLILRDRSGLAQVVLAEEDLQAPTRPAISKNGKLFFLSLGTGGSGQFLRWIQ